MPNPDEGFLYTPGPKSPAVRVGEEVVLRMTPNSEMLERLASIEKKIGIPRDPVRYPRTTLGEEFMAEDFMAEDSGKSPPPPNPLQGITEFIEKIKLPPLPPLPGFPTTAKTSALREPTAETISILRDTSAEREIPAEREVEQTTQEIIPLFRE